MCSGSRDLFKFCEITDNISDTVQYGQRCSGRPIGNHMRSISNGNNNNDLE